MVGLILLQIKQKQTEETNNDSHSEENVPTQKASDSDMTVKMQYDESTSFSRGSKQDEAEETSYRQKTISLSPTGERNLGYNVSGEPVEMTSQREPVTSQTQGSPDYETLERAAHYMKFAFAGYGWPMYVCNNPCSGPRDLCIKAG